MRADAVGALAIIRNSRPALWHNDLRRRKSGRLNGVLSKTSIGERAVDVTPPAAQSIYEQFTAVRRRQPTFEECRTAIALAAPMPKAVATRAQRYAERDVLRFVTELKRHRHCGRYRIANRDVQLRLAVDDDGRRVAHYSGLQTCGAIWTCPVCSPKIRQLRAVDADRACAKWLEEHGDGSLLLLTLTLPHDAGERLADVLASTRSAFSKLVSGRAWQQDKETFGLRYYIRAHDVTVGPNGWHPHLHLLFFADRALSADQLDKLRARLFHRWAGAVESLDRRAPNWEHGVVLEAARSRADAARYVCQVVTGEGEHKKPVAYELTRGDLKTSHHAGHRTPWQVLHDYGANHLERDRQLWQEYEKATRRVNAIRWARGLRAAVGLEDDEQTDEQLAMQEVGGEVVYTFAPNQWRALRDLTGIFERTARAELLEAAEVDGLAGVEWYLAELQRRTALDRAEGGVYGSHRPGDFRSRPVPERHRY